MNKTAVLHVAWSVVVCIVLACGMAWYALRPRQGTVPRPIKDPVVRSVRVQASVRSGALPPSRMPSDAVSEAVRHVCGLEPSTADRYERRNDALRAVARIRDLPLGDVVALAKYVASTNGSLRVEREAALKNDVLNLLLRQEPTPEGLADLLIAIVEAGVHAPVVVDYCLQHLGAMQGDVADAAGRRRIRRTFVAAARDVRNPSAGTALYSLADGKGLSSAEREELRRLTVAACSDQADPVVRMTAIQLAGERGYGEVLPILRKMLSGSRRNAVLDMATVGTLGLLGGPQDVALLESFRSRSGRRLTTAIDSAVDRISKRQKGAEK